MNTKEKINNELDQLSDERLDDVLKYLFSLRNTPASGKKNRSLHLRGQRYDKSSWEKSTSDISNKLTDFQKFLLSAPKMIIIFF